MSYNVEKSKNHENLQSKPKQKKFPDLKKHFQAYVNPDHVNLNMADKIEYTPVNAKTLQSLFPKLNKNESLDGGVEKK